MALRRFSAQFSTCALHFAGRQTKQKAKQLNSTQALEAICSLNLRICSLHAFAAAALCVEQFPQLGHPGADFAPPPTPVHTIAPRWRATQAR